MSQVEVVGLGLPGGPVLQNRALQNRARPPGRSRVARFDLLPCCDVLLVVCVGWGFLCFSRCRAVGVRDGRQVLRRLRVGANWQ
jgi:hypothetical protein